MMENKKFPPSSHDYDGWLTQYRRTARWYAKLKQFQQTAVETELSAEAEDCIYAFFQNCFHLKEWVAKSGAATQRELDLFTSNHQELQICRDICNGTKHMSIKQPSVDANFSTYREYDYLYGEGKPGATTFRILIGGKKHDIFDLADRCMKLWNNFLGDKNLLPES